MVMRLGMDGTTEEATKMDTVSAMRNVARLEREKPTLDSVDNPDAPQNGDRRTEGGKFQIFWCDKWSDLPLVDKATNKDEIVGFAAMIGEMVSRKQKAYGDSYGKSGDVMRIIYPDGIRPEQYKDALAVVRVIDKLFRVANYKDGESPWFDIAGYGLLGALHETGRSETP